MRLMRFNVKAKYVPGKDMLVADALSHSPVSTTESSSHEEVQAHVSDVQSSWQVSDAGLDKIRAETLKDVNLKSAMEYTIHGLPQYKEDVQLATRDFFIIRGELSLHDGLLMRGDRIVVPFSLRKQIMERIHKGHVGVAKCVAKCLRGKVQGTCCTITVVATDWKRPRVASCRHCLQKQPSQASEPLLPSALPDRPFQKVGIDICEFRNKHYLVQVDYYSRYIDVTYLPSLTSATVVGKLKNCFSHHGVPETVVSDNGAQFSSAEYGTFADRWSFSHVTSSGEDRQRDPQTGRHLPCPFVLPHSRPRS